MKKTFFVLAIIAGFVVLTWFGYFFWKNLRGTGPLVKKPLQDIATVVEHAQADSPNIPLTLPQGFQITIFAKGLGKPRVMVRDWEDTLLVSISSHGKVVALPDTDKNGIADRIVTVIEGLNYPHGMAFRCAPECRLYIAEEHQVYEYSYDSRTYKAAPIRKIADLPDRGMHVSRTLLFRPKPHDNQLLISVGSSCNACVEKDQRRSKILVVPIEGGELKTFVSGLRNAVFMTVHPKTKKIWATEMGRDMLGDEIPPDEINIIEQEKNYGWPFCYGKNVHDTDFDSKKENPCLEPVMTSSFIDIPAHSSPLGIAFFPEQGWPDEFQHDFLVAYHGSWNRSTPTGYKIVRYRLDKSGNYRGVDDFITGWLAKDRTALGRPVDIMIRPDGSLFVSDDKAGVIYRIYF
ncbi:MAG: PQQ-dependent sugar dehydrogenase [Nitrospirota bacterium]